MQAQDGQSLTGKTIRRNVRIGPRLGRGAMGEVYLAEETHLQRSVAVKVIRPSVLGDERFTKAFFNEGRIISQLRHPNIVSLLDFGETEEGMLYLIMEYIPGRPVSRAMATDGTESALRIANVLGQVADALVVAHAAGVIHRDIKPDNILVEELASGFELAKLVDFGLASRTYSVEGDSVTRGKVVGAPAFMSPEQARAEQVTPRSDIFSMGAVLMLLLSGHRIYEGSTVRNVLKRAAAGEVLDPRSIRPEIRSDPELDALSEVCVRATSPDPFDRFGSAADFADGVRQALVGAHREQAQSFVQPRIPAGIGCPQ